MAKKRLLLKEAKSVVKSSTSVDVLLPSRTSTPRVLKVSPNLILMHTRENSVTGAITSLAYTMAVTPTRIASSPNIPMIWTPLSIRHSVLNAS